MSITNTEYPDFIRQPFDITSNWAQLAFGQQDSLRNRVLFKAISESGVYADPLLLQVPGAYGFVAPQGYEIRRVHFCNGVAIGAWIQGPSSPSQVYIQSRTLELPIQDQMLSLTQPQQDGEFGFGMTSKGVSSNIMRITIAGLHTTLRGPFTNLPQTLSLSVSGSQFKQPLFKTAQRDGSELIAVFKVFSDTVYLYGYRYDILALARIYAIDKHQIIQAQVSILQASGPETASKVKQAFVDILMDCFGSPLVMTLKPDQQQVALLNASQYLNGQMLFHDLVLQGNDQIKAQMTGICTDAKFKDQPICSCYQSAIHPCLSPVCQQAGYKSAEVVAYACKEELKGMIINQQNCILYNQQVAGGYISGDQNIKQSCSQQVGTGGVVMNSQNTDTQASDTQKQSGQIPPLQLGLFVLVLVFAAIVGIIAWMVYNRGPRTNGQTIEPLLTEYIPVQLQVYQGP